MHIFWGDYNFYKNIYFSFEARLEQYVAYMAILDVLLICCHDTNIGKGNIIF